MRKMRDWYCLDESEWKKQPSSSSHVYLLLSISSWLAISRAFCHEAESTDPLERKTFCLFLSCHIHRKCNDMTQNFAIDKEGWQRSLPRLETTGNVLWCISRMSNHDEEKTSGWRRCEDKGIISQLRGSFTSFCNSVLHFLFRVSCYLTPCMEMFANLIFIYTLHPSLASHLILISFISVTLCMTLWMSVSFARILSLSLGFNCSYSPFDYWGEMSEKHRGREKDEDETADVDLSAKQMM